MHCIHLHLIVLDFIKLIYDFEIVRFNAFIKIYFCLFHMCHQRLQKSQNSLTLLKMLRCLREEMFEWRARLKISARSR